MLVEVYRKDGIGKLYSGMQPEITRGCLSAGLVRGIAPHPCCINWTPCHSVQFSISPSLSSRVVQYLLLQNVMCPF